PLLLSSAVPMHDSSHAPAAVSCAWIAIAAAALVGLWQELVIHYYFHGAQSGLFYAGDRFAVPPPLRSSTYLAPNSTGYDGQFYRYVAHDPFLRRGFAAWVDDSRHRYGRILTPLLAFAAALGRDDRIDRAYQLVIAVFIAFGVYWCSRYFAAHLL